MDWVMNLTTGMTLELNHYKKREKDPQLRRIADTSYRMENEIP
jgi:hypothetical protein